MTDDPVRDFLDDDEKRERALAERPVCVNCGEHITEDHYYEVEGDVLCVECMKALYERSVDCD